MPPAKNSKSGKSRVDIIQAITTPLGFYVLSLLIIEATLGLVLTSSKLTETHVWIGFFVRIGLFLIVFVVVSGLVIWRPKNLFYGKEEHFSPALDPSALQDAIEDSIHVNVKPECLQKTEKDENNNMNWQETVTDPDEIKVFMALDGPRYTWRTTSAIARQTGLSEDRVVQILAKYNLKLTRLSETPSVSGSALVGLIEKVGA